MLSSAPSAESSTDEEDTPDTTTLAVQAADDERARATVAATQARQDRMDVNAIQTNDTIWWATVAGRQLMATYNHSSLERVHLKLVESSAFTDLFNPNMPELSVAGVHASADLIRFVARTDELPAVPLFSGESGLEVNVEMSVEISEPSGPAAEELVSEPEPVGGTSGDEELDMGELPAPRPITPAGPPPSARDPRGRRYETEADTEAE